MIHHGVVVAAARFRASTITQKASIVVVASLLPQLAASQRRRRRRPSTPSYSYSYTTTTTTIKNKMSPADLKPKKSVGDMNDLAGKKVLLRVDFNVPLDKKTGEITNDLRIRAALPTINKILSQKGSVILMSHLGRPKKDLLYEDVMDDPSKRDFSEMKSASLKPAAERLEALLKADSPDTTILPVLFADDCLNADAVVAQLQPGQALLLENVRFYKNEGSKKESERLSMATKIASYGDVYVSDAFGTAHRNSATMTGIPTVMKQGSAGYLMDKEIKAFLQILVDPPRPLCAIVGGAKVSDKILLLENLLGKIDKLLIGGAMAYTFLKAQGHTTGTSLVEEDQLDLAKKLIEQAKEKGVHVCLPVDHVCHTEFGQTDTPLITEGVDIPDGYMALDIGPKTLEIYLAQIKESKACLWNGPMGVFEIDTYSNGTFSVAKTMAEMTQCPDHHLLSIIGGGDSAAAAEQSGQADKMSHVSTGGGASLELLEGKVLPGLNVLDDA